MLFGNDVGTFLLTVLLGATVSVVLLILAVLEIRRQIHIEPIDVGSFLCGMLGSVSGF